MSLRILHIIWSVSPQGGGPIEGILQQDSAGKPSGVSREIVSLDAPADRFATDGADFFAGGIERPLGMSKPLNNDLGATGPGSALIL